MTHDLHSDAAGSSTARSMPGDGMRDLLAGCPVMPILTVHDLSTAAPLARALVAGGIHIFEVLMRTTMACDAVAEMRAAVPEAVVGMGTLLTPDDVARAVAAGAHFGVSPGLTAVLADAVVHHGLPFLAASHDGHVGATCGRDGYAWCKRGLLRRVPAPAAEVDAARGAGVGG